MKTGHRRRSFARRSGYSLIEILIALFIGAFGLLALAGFVTKSTTLTADSSQRARAGALLNDMANRIASRRQLADEFVTEETHGAAPSDCAGLEQVALDLCEWNNLLAGANDGGGALGYRGCIERPVGDPNAYIVTVAWGSLTPGVPPHENVTCGFNEFGDETYRRILRTQVRVPSLTGT